MYHSFAALPGWADAIALSKKVLKQLKPLSIFRTGICVELFHLYQYTFWGEEALGAEPKPDPLKPYIQCQCYQSRLVHQWWTHCAVCINSTPASWISGRWCPRASCDEKGAARRLDWVDWSAAQSGWRIPRQALDANFWRSVSARQTKIVHQNVNKMTLKLLPPKDGPSSLWLTLQKTKSLFSRVQALSCKCFIQQWRSAHWKRLFKQSLSRLWHSRYFSDTVTYSLRGQDGKDALVCAIIDTFFPLM